MKKLLIFLLLAAMVFSFASCKENDDKSQQTAKTYTFTSGTTKIAIDADAAPFWHLLASGAIMQSLHLALSKVSIKFIFMQALSCKPIPLAKKIMSI